MNLQVAQTSADPGALDVLLDVAPTEVRGIAELFTPSQLLVTASWLLLAWLSGKGFAWMMKVAWRLGFDPKHRLARTEGVFRVGIVAGCFYLVLLRFLHRAPTLTGFALVVFIAAGSIALSPQLQNLASGAQLLLRRKIRPGDRVQVQGCAGVVDRVGLTRMVLRSADGSRTHIPNRVFDSEVLTVVRAKDSVPVQLTLRLAQPVDVATIESARSLALLSPYRVAGSRVHAQRVLNAPNAVQVEVHVWTDAAREPALEHLDAALRAAGIRTSQTASDAAGESRARA